MAKLAWLAKGPTAAAARVGQEQLCMCYGSVVSAPDPYDLHGAIQTV